MEGFHPKLVNLDESRSFLGFPSGFASSKTISPGNLTTSLILSTRDLIVTSWLLPMLYKPGSISFKITNSIAPARSSS